MFLHVGTLLRTLKQMCAKNHYVVGLYSLEQTLVVKGLFLNGRSCGKIEKGMGNIAVGKSLTDNLIKGNSAWLGGGRNLGKASYSEDKCLH